MKNKEPFGSSLWNHYSVYKQIMSYRRPVNKGTIDTGLQYWIGRPSAKIERAKHSGTKENCLKCREDGTMDNFTNYPTFKGFLVLFATLISIIVILVLIMNVTNLEQFHFHS